MKIDIFQKYTSKLCSLFIHLVVFPLRLTILTNQQNLVFHTAPVLETEPAQTIVISQIKDEHSANSQKPEHNHPINNNKTKATTAVPHLPEPLTEP